jgi:cytoskeletal protein RodZ
MPYSARSSASDWVSPTPLPQYATKLGIDESEVEQYYIDKVPLKRGCDYQDVLNAPYPTYSFVARISAAPSGNLLKHHLAAGDVNRLPGAVRCLFQSLLPQYATKLGIDESEVEQYYIDKVPLKRGCG